MSRPHQVLPRGFYLITRRCAQQQFLLRPDAKTNEAFIYCLAEAAQKTGVAVIMTCVLSNHHHTVIYDPLGNEPALRERFHALVARCLNSHRGRSENFWSAEAPSVVELADVSAVIDAVVYAATNPVKDGLVECVDYWPGVNGLSALLERRAVTARRPEYFRDKGPMPETGTLELVVPAELGDPDSFLQIIGERVRSAVDQFNETRRQQGRRALGRDRVLRQSWRGSPASAQAPLKRRDRTKISPRFATRDPERREQLITRRGLFLRDYRSARTAWLAGTPIPFPLGTYWLRRFAGVPIVSVSN